MKFDQAELIQLFIEAEFDYKNNFQSIFNWAYNSLEQNIDDKNHNITLLAGLPPSDAKEVIRCLEKIIGRTITIEEKEEWGGKFVCKLWFRFKNNQLDEWELGDQLFKLYEYLGEPNWLAFASNINLYNADFREEFLPHIAEKLSHVIDLWTQYPNYSEFKEKFNNFQEEFQKNISCHYVFKGLFEVFYFPYIWKEDYIDYKSKNEAFKRGIRKKGSFVLVCVNVEISQSVHMLYAKCLHKAEKELSDYQLIDKGETILCGIKARWCSYSYTEQEMKIKVVKYFLVNSLKSYTITFEADMNTYSNNESYFDAFLKSFKLL